MFTGRLKGVSWRLLIAVGAICGQAYSQDGYYHPLSEKLPPGYSAQVLARIRAEDPNYLQPVRVELPTEGSIAVYSAVPEPLAVLPAPAGFSVTAGHHYRLKISDMPEFPGIEIYPSIEILDRLHPPAGMASSFPIPVIFSRADLEEAIAGRMVTRIIYLEQPQFAAALDPLRREIPQSVSPAENALREADRLGRPMIIVRIGGRIPDSHEMTGSFFGSGGPFDIGPNAVPHDSTVNLRHSASVRISAAGR